MKMLQTDYQVSGRPGTNLEIRPKLLHVTLDLLLLLSLRLGIQFDKSLINILTIILFYDNPE